MKKKCPKCKKEKNVEEFYTHKNASDGRASTCKECEKLGRKKRRDEIKKDLIYAF